ncbi:hypothetical protein E5F05_16515 [Deinococcus metallilatus]|uniref:Uncharacterized protein n=1 Tax=Deinococcus metallilatus TaxID=1211322 RepID=A0AAJ5K5N2_9DEIO|nr:hypothetical protein [Deinococcus metallilatus]MBB5294887.1 hypothetical protein [Deinococcus metallilatus]QBY09400.1 hypothetical protein E5F05_16515 [Deinococcus metallilatus]RXJ09406.1 hypothetical protein ERJ73_15355 [Deinococcus metallilatus]TLK28928.1 hypothetical protein FCS05_07120 [Deinococcus metallilatus]GMA16816.1 hypothetical protein GCM10025871_31470 [Deinococcus metallilatus]
MEFLRLIHGYQFGSALALLFPTPYALATLILFLWSLGPALKGVVRTGFLVWLRLTWVLTLIPVVTGVILAVGGEKVPSATNVGGGLTKYGYPVDPSRDWEHWMYSAFALLSLYVIEVLVKGRLISHRRGLRYLPVATLFLYGCAYMIGRVAVFPGSTPGT